MIKATLFEDANGTLWGYDIQGHAGYAMWKFPRSCPDRKTVMRQYFFLRHCVLVLKKSGIHTVPVILPFLPFGNKEVLDYVTDESSAFRS